MALLTTTRAKLLASFGALTLLTAGVGALGLRAAGVLEEHLDAIGDNFLPALKAATDAQQGLY